MSEQHVSENNEIKLAGTSVFRPLQEIIEVAARNEENAPSVRAACVQKLLFMHSILMGAETFLRMEEDAHNEIFPGDLVNLNRPIDEFDDPDSIREMLMLMMLGGDEDDEEFGEQLGIMKKMYSTLSSMDGGKTVAEAAARYAEIIQFALELAQKVEKRGERDQLLHQLIKTIRQTSELVPGVSMFGNYEEEKRTIREIFDQIEGADERQSALEQLVEKEIMALESELKFPWGGGSGCDMVLVTREDLAPKDMLFKWKDAKHSPKTCEPEKVAEFYAEYGRRRAEALALVEEFDDLGVYERWLAELAGRDRRIRLGVALGLEKLREMRPDADYPDMPESPALEEDLETLQGKLVFQRHLANPGYRSSEIKEQAQKALDAVFETLDEVEVVLKTGVRGEGDSAERVDENEVEALRNFIENEFWILPDAVDLKYGELAKKLGELNAFFALDVLLRYELRPESMLLGMGNKKANCVKNIIGGLEIVAAKAPARLAARARADIAQALFMLSEKANDPDAEELAGKAAELAVIVAAKSDNFGLQYGTLAKLFVAACIADKAVKAGEYGDQLAAFCESEDGSVPKEYALAKLADCGWFLAYYVLLGVQDVDSEYLTVATGLPMRAANALPEGNAKLARTLIGEWIQKLEKEGCSFDSENGWRAAIIAALADAFKDEDPAVAGDLLLKFVARAFEAELRKTPCPIFFLQI